VASGPGETPDLEPSPEVLIWMWMFRGVGEGSSERPLLSWEAFFWVSTEETRKRLGIWEARGLHLSVEAEVLALSLCLFLYRFSVNGDRY
jgi:hypothetical protein